MPRHFRTIKKARLFNQETSELPVLPLSFMQSSRHAPQPHQLMCVSITGESRVKLLKTFRRTSSRTSYYESHALSYTDRQLSLPQTSAFFPIKAFQIFDIIIFQTNQIVKSINILFTILMGILLRNI